MAKAESHPEAIFDGTTLIDDEGVRDKPWKGDRYNGLNEDIRLITLIIISLNYSCNSISKSNTYRFPSWFLSGIHTVMNVLNPIAIHIPVRIISWVTP
jgi:hypothetical protein